MEGSTAPRLFGRAVVAKGKARPERFHGMPPASSAEYPEADVPMMMTLGGHPLPSLRRLPSIRRGPSLDFLTGSSA